MDQPSYKPWNVLFTTENQQKFVFVRPGGFATFYSQPMDLEGFRKNYCAKGMGKNTAPVEIIEIVEQYFNPPLSPKLAFWPEVFHIIGELPLRPKQIQDLEYLVYSDVEDEPENMTPEQYVEGLLGELDF